MMARSLFNKVIGLLNILIISIAMSDKRIQVEVVMKFASKRSINFQIKHAEDTQSKKTAPQLKNQKEKTTKVGFKSRINHRYRNYFFVVMKICL